MRLLLCVGTGGENEGDEEGRGREKRLQHDKEGFGARKRDKSFFV